ncbi:hypothetical protein K5D44_07680 [Pseudomonas cichorii]|uniref:Uncharacterized protein n=1 Tax=Pseudomonas cichorii TaxID=36746 RepID=A0A3M4VRX0_PSECI|nr:MULTISPECIES: hypothetical protein [Pseudomonas]MBX8492943.1 hypothetical protein [Pseudomonas cichorii]MBX8521082.1 hypothetical protein [Pseudomonas cichorii]MBX8545943.1 hypothetical protein [Pseudomonas cichorii]MBX8551360.1 hypothetical protein [Pseudomonas cichorii]MBX8560305.1 hypothetical protein [Pseudomonas cichorii]
MPNLEAVAAPELRPDTWSPATTSCCARYQVLAEAEPALLCQVLNLFAMQYLTPQNAIVSRQDGLMAIDVTVDGLSWHRAQVIGEKMRNLIDVCSVELEQIHTPQAAHQHVALVAG